jgi:hypothetical protein
LNLFFVVLLRCTVPVYPFVSSNSSYVSSFGVRLLITPFVSSNSYCISFFRCVDPDYSICIFKLLLSVLLRCTSRTHKKSLKIQRDNQGPYTEEEQPIRVWRYKRINKRSYIEEGQSIRVWRYKRSDQRAVHEERHTRRVWRYKGSNQGPYTKKDIHEEFEDTKGVIRGRTRRKTYTKSSKIQRE